jgi:sterol 24-C-methyltransferase
VQAIWAKSVENRPNKGFPLSFMGTFTRPHYSTGLLFPVENGKWQTYAACQQMYQCYLALALQADETMTIGDFGCGTGGPTRCIAQFTGAKIKAVNLTKRHLDQMARWNREENIDHRIDLVAADYHHTPFEDNSLDGVYMMESLGHSPNYKLLCKEVYRVLKPGARFTGFNWDLTDKFDESDPDHRRIRVMIERGVGMAKMSKISDLTTAMKEAGFEIMKQRDHNEFGMKLGAKPWHFLLDEKSTRTSFLGPVFFLVSATTKGIFAGLWVLEKLRMVTPGTSRAYKTVMVSLHDGMKEGIEQEIFTPMHFWLAQKPLNAKK